MRDLFAETSVSYGQPRPGSQAGDLLAEVSDPACAPLVLSRALRMVETSADLGPPDALFHTAERRSYLATVRSAILRNPSLPGDLLREQMAAGEVDAWMNSAVPLLLLESPMAPEDELEEGLCGAAIGLSRHIADEGFTDFEDNPCKIFAEHGGAILAGQHGEFWDQWRDHLRRIADREQTPHPDEAG